MTDRKGVKGYRSTPTWQPGPEAKAILIRIVTAAEKTGVVKVVHEFTQTGSRPAYYVYEDKLIKPIEMWRAYRLVMDGKSDAPEGMRHRALEAFKTANADILTDADCLFILKEWSFDTWRQVM